MSSSLRKSIVLATLISIIAPFFPLVSASGVVDFAVKISTAWNESYANTLQNVSYYNNDVTFRFTEVSTTGAWEYSLNLPAGFIHQSHNTTDNTCANFSVQNASNGNYHFSFNGTPGCLAQTEFTYRITSTTATGNIWIYLLEKNGINWSILKDITLGITSANTITRATTADLNNNGYIDAYILSFATGGVTSGLLSGITVEQSTTGTATASGSQWILPFTDNFFKTGLLPQINGVFDGVTLNNMTVLEEDRAPPHALIINGTGAIVPSLNIGTNEIAITFSEQLSPTSIWSFQLKRGTGTIAGNFILSLDWTVLVFNPTTPLAPGTYTITNTTGATDWIGINSITQTYPSLIVPDITAPTSGSIVINGGAASTSSQTVSLTLSATDDVGVTGMMVSNSPSFAWASWEAYSTSKSWNLSSNTAGNYTVYVRFRDLEGNISSDASDSINIIVSSPSSGGWNNSGWWSSSGGNPTPNNGTSLPIVPWISPETNSPSNLSMGTIGTKYFTSLAEARKYLLDRISHRAIVKLINSYGDKLIMEDESYFLSVDKELYSEYNKSINAYVILFSRVQDLVSGNKTQAIKDEGKASYKLVANGLILAKNVIDRYVNRDFISEKNITLYRTKNTALTKPLWALEKKIIAKFDALLWSESISQEEYNTSVQAYNDFVLHLMIYRDYGKTSVSKERAIAAMKIFMTTYKKKVGDPIVEPSLSDELLKKQQEYKGE